MLDLFSFLYGIVAVLIVEDVVLILVIAWLRKRARRYEKTG